MMTLTEMLTGERLEVDPAAIGGIIATPGEGALVTIGASYRWVREPSEFIRSMHVLARQTQAAMGCEHSQGIQAEAPETAMHYLPRSARQLAAADLWRYGV